MCDEVIIMTVTGGKKPLMTLVAGVLYIWMLLASPFVADALANDLGKEGLRYALVRQRSQHLRTQVGR
jgi:hypothetical protein